jgi:hypothetical protein
MSLVLIISWLALGAEERSLQNPERSGVQVLPKVVAEANPEKITHQLVIENSGKLRANLVLRLDHFPEPAEGKRQLPKCRKSFPDTFEFGYLRCTSGKEARVPVLGKHLDQECYTSETPKRIKAKELLRIEGCTLATLHMHEFEPKLFIDREVR